VGHGKREILYLSIIVALALLLALGVLLNSPK
jgi:hypothetical protein